MHCAGTMYITINGTCIKGVHVEEDNLYIYTLDVLQQIHILGLSFPYETVGHSETWTLYLFYNICQSQNE